MNTATFLAAFPRQLRCWTIHCSLNSSPSFCIALGILGLWENPLAIFAMLCAIATFILLYAVFTSVVEPLADEKHVISRSLKLGTKIRAWISGLSLVVVFTPAASITPDFWCGLMAVMFTNSLSKWAGASGNAFSVQGGNATFTSVYTITMVEGFILSFILFMISFFAVLFVQARDRKRIFTVTNPS